MTTVFTHPARVLAAVENGFGGGNIVVIGDLMLDRYQSGTVERISPEAPVPIVRLREEIDCGGGAANVALNLSALGATVSLIGVIGDDGPGRALQRILETAHIDRAGLVTVAGRATTTKTRVVSGHQQMIRLDREETARLADDSIAEVVTRALQQISAGASIIVLSDYGKGVMTADVSRAIIHAATKRGIPVLVDAKGPDYAQYAGATALAPNRRELAGACGVDPADLSGLLSAGHALRADLHLEYLVATFGDQGMVLLDERHTEQVPAVIRDVFDVSGAGDTAIAILAASHGAGLPRLDAVRLANVGAGISVGKVGTAPVTRDDLLHELSLRQSAHKICSLRTVTRLVDEWRQRGDTIVFTNGCFDLFHSGHVALLTAAKASGDRLVVALNSDRSVRALKGPTRPVIHAADRAAILAALQSVDAVVSFDDDTPIRLIRVIRPDVLVKGGDYTEKTVVGARDVHSWGGRVVLIPRANGVSSSTIINAVDSAHQPATT